MELYILKAKGVNDINLRNEFFRKAIYHGERTLEIYPNNPVVIMELGTAYFGIGDYFKTANLWIKNYKLIPEDPKAKYWLEFVSNTIYKQGNLFLEQGNTTNAIRYYSKALELNKNNVEAIYNLGGTYLLMNDTIKASELWGNVKKLSPGHPLKKEDFLNSKQ
jgi:tetratricopeptide (TPR) repeat protein